MALVCTIPRRTGIFLVLLCGLLLIAVSPVCAATISPDPINDSAIWSLSDTLHVAMITSVVVSPAGLDIAYVVRQPVIDANTSEFRYTISSVRSDGSGTRQLTNTSQSCTHPAWSPDGQRIAYISRENGSPQVWIMNVDGSGVYCLTDQETGVSGFSWSPDGKLILYASPTSPTEDELLDAAAKEDPIVSGTDLPGLSLYLVPVVTAGQGRPAARLLTPANISAGSWDWLPDSSGVVVVQAPLADAQYGLNTTISLLDLRDGMTTLLVPAAKGHAAYSQILVSPDGQWVAYSTMQLFNIMDISVVPVSGGTSRTIISGLDEGAVAALGMTGWSVDGTTLYIPETKGTSVTMNAVPVNGSAPQELFRYGNIVTMSENSRRTVFAYASEDAALPSEIYTTPTGTFEPFQVTRINEGLPTGKIGKTEVIRWNSTDGTAIEGLLTLPANYTPGTTYPLIIESHGGPSANFVRYFIGGATWPILTAGTFSSLGYAVLRPNIRGSTGYGVNFTEANYADWGGGDYRDLMSGADYLVGQGIADPDHMGIIGQSYGGYMAAWTVTQTNRFKGAVVIDGITDLVSNTGTNDIPFDEPDNFGGEFWDKWNLYTSRSPIRYVGNVSTPTLIVSGQNDVRVPLGQSQEFYTALWKRDIPSQLVIYPRAGHFPGEPKQWKDLWLREINWMNTYVKG